MKKITITIILLLLSMSLYSQDIEVYVSDVNNRANPPFQILKFDGNGENPEVFISTPLNRPQDIVFLDDFNTVLISNLGDNRITRHNAETGVYINDFAGSISQPTRMKIGPDNLLYVLQWAGNGKVLRYQLDGTFVGEFTSIGVSQGIGLDWDSSGNLYVASFNGPSVRKFDSSGNDAGLFINSNLLGPTNIWFDDEGDLLVSDWSGSSVKRFSSSGDFLGNFITGLKNSEGVDIFSNGNILIGNGSSSSVRMFDSDGNFIKNFVDPGGGGLVTPVSIVIRNDPEPQAFRINAGLNDAWFNPATDGQGFFINVYPDLGFVSLAWFTYDTDLPTEDETANLGDPGHRWLTAIGPITENKSVMNVSITSGGIFDTPTEIVRTDDGTITVTFDNCSGGTVAYDIPSINRQGEVPISRVAGDNIALCEILKDE